MKQVNFTCKYIDSVISKIRECRGAIELGIKHDSDNPHLEDAFSALYRLEDEMEDIRTDNIQLRDNWIESDERIKELEDELKEINI